MSPVREHEGIAVDELGTKRIDELNDMIGDRASPLSVVMFTKDEVFDDVPIRAWWIHGNFAFDPGKRRERAELVFDVPDEVWRRVQSRYATKVKDRFFGPASPVSLHRAIRTSTDETRDVRPRAYKGSGFTTDLFSCSDWDTLRHAIQTTAESVDTPDSYTGHHIKLNGGYAAFARINEDEDRIEIYIGNVVGEIVSNWQVALQKKLGLS